MKYATFINFTDKPFTGYWNGRPYTFAPGQKKEHLNYLIAVHFAKHLTNQVLTDMDKAQYCSPKKPEDVPEFMNIFNKACMVEDGGAEHDLETGLPIDGGQNHEAGQPDQPDTPGMNVKVKPRGQIDPYDSHSQPTVGPGDKPQVIGTIESSDEETFEGNQSEGDGV